MDWPILEPPTWAERQTYGPQLTTVQMAELVFNASTEPLGWRHIHFLATMMRENQLYAWARPLVWKPGNEAHLSIDRGVCALNSYWWRQVSDVDAYEPQRAVLHSIEFCEQQAAAGTRGAKLWDWGPILDWQWHAYMPGLPEYKEALAEARAAINTVRADHNITGI